MTSMKITQLNVENFKRLKAVQIDLSPDGGVVVVGGRNAQGKTSVLDAILAGLAGRGSAPPRPVRDGEDKALIEMTVGGYRVRRTFTSSGGGTVKVTNADGHRMEPPQKVLDGLLGKTTIDPLAFMRLKPADQAATLRDLVGLDLSEMDATRAQTYAERTAVNREVKSLEAQVKAAPHHPDAQDTETPVAEVMAEMERAQATNRANADVRARAAKAEGDVSAVEAEIAALEAKLARARETLAATKREALDLRADAEAVVDVDLDPIRERLAGLDAENRKVRENLAHAELEARLEKKVAEAQAKTDHIEAIDRKKAQALAAVEFPVEGLGFGAEGVTLNGFPLEQASGAEQIRVSVAMGVAANPNLRVLLIRDGSLLDEDNLRLVAELAQEHDAQVWIERVGNDGTATVVIEDGEVLP